MAWIRCCGGKSTPSISPEFQEFIDTTQMRQFTISDWVGYAYSSNVALSKNSNSVNVAIPSVSGRLSTLAQVTPINLTPLNYIIVKLKITSTTTATVIAGITNSLSNSPSVYAQQRIQGNYSDEEMIITLDVSSRTGNGYLCFFANSSDSAGLYDYTITDVTYR